MEIEKLSSEISYLYLPDLNTSIIKKIIRRSLIVFVFVDCIQLDHFGHIQFKMYLTPPKSH